MVSEYAPPGAKAFLSYITGNADPLLGTRRYCTNPAQAGSLAWDGRRLQQAPLISVGQ